MKYFSMFSGIGGFELGIQRAFDTRYKATHRQETTENIQGVVSDTEQHDVQRAVSCVGYSEIDKYAIKVYERNFNGHTNYGNATKIDSTELPNFDLLVGGFPCQAFSIAGKRAGFDDTRGTLFFDIARILKEKQPRHLVLENVKGLLSHNGGRTFTTILGVLADLGYFVEWQVLNSKDFGVPQNRERVFIIGHLGGFGGRQVFPIGEESTEDTRRVGKEISYTIDASYAKGTNTIEKSRRQIVKVSGDLDKRKTYLGDIASTLAANPTSDNTARLLEENKIRRLTPTECERLQGFPDGWTAGESDTQRYKMCGNAVTVNVIEAIMTNLVKCMYEYRKPVG